MTTLTGIPGSRQCAIPAETATCHQAASVQCAGHGKGQAAVCAGCCTPASHADAQMGGTRRTAVVAQPRREVGGADGELLIRHPNQAPASCLHATTLVGTAMGRKHHPLTVRHEAAATPSNAAPLAKAPPPQTSWHAQHVSSTTIERMLLRAGPRLLLAIATHCRAHVTQWSLLYPAPQQQLLCLYQPVPSACCDS